MRTFKESPDASEEFTFRIRALDNMELFASSAYADQLCSRHVFGGWSESDGMKHEKPELWLIPNEDGSEHKIEVTPGSMRILARLEWQQGLRREYNSDAIPAEGYTAKELAWMTVTHPSVFDQFWNWAEEVQGKGQKKATGLSGTSSSPDSPAEAGTPNPNEA